MTKSALYDITKKRLRDYELFSDTTVETVARVAEKQAGYKTYQSYFASFGGLEPVVHQRTSKDGVPYVDVPARSNVTRGVIVVHLPMANPLDPNQRFQIATIADSNPEYRIIGFGNPSHKPYKHTLQNKTLRARYAIAWGRNKKALVAAELDYLQAQGIKGIHHAGYSYGAHKALVAAKYAPTETIAGIILVDPVAHSRGIRQLLGDFKRTFKDLGAYVNRTELPQYFAARKDSQPTESHDKKYLRPINIAIGFMLARLDLMTLLRDVLQQKQIPTSVAWGVQSELGNDAHLKTSLDKLGEIYPGKIKQFRLKDDSHAFANDIYLHAAIIRESLSNSQ